MENNEYLCTQIQNQRHLGNIIMKQSFSLILLIACALILLVGYSFIPQDSMLAQTLGLKQLRVPAFVSTDDAAVDADSTKVVGKENEQQVDSMKQRVLLIGDSMNERLRLSLAGWCNANGHELTSVVWYGSSSKTWAETDTLQHFIRISNPTHIFICLGGNELYVRDLDDRDRYISTIKRKCGIIPTIWIGPPNWCKDTGINKLIEKHMGKRAYFPSLNLTFERSSDGHHVTQRSADNWMDEVVKWMNEGNSIHPFVLSRPRCNKTTHLLFVLAPYEQVKNKLSEKKNETRSVPIVQEAENNMPKADTLSHNQDKEIQ